MKKPSLKDLEDICYEQFATGEISLIEYLGNGLYKLDGLICNEKTIQKIENGIKEIIMTEQELFRIKAQKAVLEDVAKEYPSRTIENIIANIDARIKNHEKQRKEGKA